MLRSGPVGSHLRLVVLQVMAPQPVIAKIVPRRTKYGVDVVWVVWPAAVRRKHIVILDQDGWPVNPVVKRFPWLGRTHPGKMQFVETGGLHRRAIGAGDVRAQVA